MMNTPHIRDYAGKRVHMIGIGGTMALRYYTGTEMGEGYTLKILRKYPGFDAVLRKNGLSNAQADFVCFSNVCIQSAFKK